jgi:LysM repeat protein
VLSVSSYNTKNNSTSGTPSTLTTNGYVYWDGAVQSTITHDGDTGTTSNAVYNTSFAYDEQGRLTGATIGDYLYRSVSFVSDELGQIIRRDETRPYSAPAAQSGSPHEVWYRFAGRQLGYTGNNGTSDVTTAASIGERQMASPTAGNIGTFRNSSTYGASYGDFAQSYDPLNSYNQGAGSGSYTVRTGDTLQSIAQSIYGDGNLWYKIAEANGLSGNASLIEGRSLTLPAGVAKNTYNTDTLRPYNPQEAIGDLSPTNAKPPKKPKCGGLGMILLAVIAIAVTTIVTAGAAAAASSMTFGQALGAIFTGTLATGTAAVGTTAAVAGIGTLGAIGAGAVGAVAGSIVSQGVGVATGIQDKFSWKAVALAGLGSIVGGGVSAATGSGNSWLAAIGRASATNAITQGIGVATGLQTKFDWAGVAAAGVGAGVGSLVGGNISGQAKAATATSAATQASFSNFAASTAAGAIANAATRSAINGESFGQNLIAAIPDVLAGILQRAIGTAMDGVKTPAKVGAVVGTPVAAANNDDQAAEKNTVGERAVAAAINYNDPDDIAAKAPFSEGHPSDTTDNDGDTSGRTPSPDAPDKNGNEISLGAYAVKNGLELMSASAADKQEEVNYLGKRHFSETIDGVEYVLDAERQAESGYQMGWQIANDRPAGGINDSGIREYYGLGLQDKNYGVGFQAIADGYNDRISMIRTYANEVLKQTAYDFAKIYAKEAVSMAVGGLVVKGLFRAGVWLVPRAASLFTANAAAKRVLIWTLGEGKSAARWTGQMERRGWSPSQIDEALASGKQFPAPNNLNPANRATRFVHPETGRSVVIDSKTGQVIHVGGDGFKY